MPEEQESVPGRNVDEHIPVRLGYDAVAEAYLAHFGDELAGKPLDRARSGAVGHGEKRPGVEATLERVHYPHEVDTRRVYVVAQRR